jgi:formate/nitrite transporter
MLVLLGLELVTGNFALLPMAMYGQRADLRSMAKNFALVTMGNVIGSLIYAFLFWANYSSLGMDSSGGKVGAKTAAIAIAKTVAYQKKGARGWFTALTKAIGCNWMVTMGVMMGFTSKSTAGRIAAMWMPIMVFFAHGYEHAVVNFFVIPAGMFFSADVNVFQWWFWNQLPVLIGNFIGGCCLTGLPLAYAFPVETAILRRA